MAQIALTIDGLGVDFGGFKAVNGVSLTVEDGELRVLLGANGAGKTTLMDLMSGKTKSTEGRVFLHDTDITNWEEHKIARAGIGRKFQIPSIFKDLTVRRNLEVASCRKPGVLERILPRGAENPVHRNAGRTLTKPAVDIASPVRPPTRRTVVHIPAARH